MTAAAPRGFLERLHERYVSPRRAKQLCRHLAPLMPPRASVLDVGCGSGTLAALIDEQRPDLTWQGIDVLAWPAPRIPLQVFDGQTIPYGPASFDVVLLVDTLHHTTDPLVLLREAARVSRRTLVIKDHTCDGLLAGPILRAMDQVGNARHGVALPYTYWPKRRWLEALGALGLRVVEWRSRLGLYPWPASLVVERSLHFIAQIEIAGPPR